MIFALFALWYLPRSAAEAKFLSPEEKELAYLRLQIDSSSVVDEKLNIRDAFRVFKHWTSWAILAIQVCLGVPLQGVQLFLPVIIGRLNYGTVKTNLFTVAPNVSGAAMLLILAFCSDWTRWRFPFIALGFLFTFIGFIIYAAIDVKNDINVAYFASFMMTWYVLHSSHLLLIPYLGILISFQGNLRTLRPPRRLVQQQRRQRRPPRRFDEYRCPHRQPDGSRGLEHLPQSRRTEIPAGLDYHCQFRRHWYYSDYMSWCLDDDG